MDKKDLLKRYWGYDTFRPLQEEIIDSVLAGHDTLALLPTGGGKSLCYQIPALMAEGLCIVVSPLIALMKDQVEHLNKRKVKAACLVSGMGQEHLTSTLLNCIAGEVKILYVSPERLQQRLFVEYLRRMKVSMIAVDEAHCVSQWGYDFRPSYLTIASIRQYHPQAPLLALTATATPAVADDIIRQLQMHDTRRYTASFARPNLAYKVVHDNNKNERLRLLATQYDGSGIVYTRSRSRTKVLADMLQSHDISATYYHAGLESRERDLRQEMWMKGQCKVMVATTAFGMGIDKPDVRFVVHVDCPDSLEAYFQEAGRAGRDGAAAEAVMICSDNENARLEHNLEVDYPPLRYIRNVYRAICNYYRIPLGSGADSQYDYRIEEICSTYNFAVRDFYSACRFLERAGLIALPTSDDMSSTLFIPGTRDEVYRFRVNHLRLGTTLETVLRMYPGIGMAPVNIDERKIARRALTDTADVVAQLKQMHEMHIVEYRRQSKSPQIVFTSARIDEGSIHLGEQNYDRLKLSARERMEAMQHYLDNSNTCRSRQLLAYFGQTEGVCNCGVCDVCQSHSRSGTVIEDDIRRVLGGKRYTIHELHNLMGHYESSVLASAVREMMERGDVQMDADMRLSLS